MAKYKSREDRVRSQVQELFNESNLQEDEEIEVLDFGTKTLESGEEASYFMVQLSKRQPHTGEWSTAQKEFGFVHLNRQGGCNQMVEKLRSEIVNSEEFGRALEIAGHLDTWQLWFKQYGGSKVVGHIKKD